MKLNLATIISDFGFDDYGAKRLDSGLLRVVCIRAVDIYDDEGCECEIAPYYLTSNQGSAGFSAMLTYIKEQGNHAQATPRGTRMKPLANECGLGFIGRNTLCINRDFGSDFYICAFDTDLPADERVAGGASPRICDKCGRCEKACPTGAIGGEKRFDRAKCLRNYMFTGEPVPEEYRKLMGKQLLGCKFCQDACPYNAKRKVLPQPESLRDVTKLIHLIDYENDPFKKERQALFGSNYMRGEKVCAQALIAAANDDRRDLLPVIEKLKEHKNPAVAEHAKWACEKLG